MPRAVYVLALGIFAMVTSEFVVAGLMPQMADGLDATIPQIGYLITAFAVAMAAGGPFLTVAVMKLPPRTALMALFAVFLAGNVLAATATGYPVMMAARIVTGIASQAFKNPRLWLALSTSTLIIGPPSSPTSPAARRPHRTPPARRRFRRQGRTRPRYAPDGRRAGVSCRPCAAGYAGPAG